MTMYRLKLPYRIVNITRSESVVTKFYMIVD